MQSILDFYGRPSMMTSVDHHGPQFDELPRDVAGLVHVVQGLLMHEHWAPAYGVTLTEEQKSGSQIRSAARMLDRLLKLSDRSFAEQRPAEDRLVGVCRHFTVLLVTLLRAQGVPARARCGFSGYFTPGYFEDHWVCEYWDITEGRWILVDAQVDTLQQEKLNPDFDLYDVPRDRFVIAGDAWTQCRTGAAAPVQFGLSAIPGEHGLWFIASNLLRDAAALNNVEMLPWDDWGAMPGPNKPITDDELAFFDRLADLTHAPDAFFPELRFLYINDRRLSVPALVHNAVLGLEEAIDHQVV